MAERFIVSQIDTQPVITTRDSTGLTQARKLAIKFSLDVCDKCPYKLKQRWVLRFEPNAYGDRQDFYPVISCSNIGASDTACSM